MPLPDDAQSDLAPATDIPGPTPLPRHVASQQSDELAARSRASNKHTSPSPPPSSMTPPPSSQMPQAGRTIARTPTPPTPQLSSPPPTVKPAPQSEDPTSSSAVVGQEEIHNATPEELRGMVSDLAAALRDSRTTGAHYKLQYRMLCMDSAEASNRMTVELAMAQREVDVLQQAEERRLTEALAPMQSWRETNAANATLLDEISRHCSLLRSENDELRDMLAQSRRAVEQREADMAEVVEENERLRGRIRKNREHMNALLDHMHDGTRGRLPSTRLATPRRRANVPGEPAPQDSRLREPQPFEALLLADRVLNQELTAVPPSPPRKQHTKHRFEHSRGSRSLTSLPATPSTARPTGTEAGLPRTPLNSATVGAYPHTAPAAHHASATCRRASNGSRISASSAGAEEEQAGDRDVPEPQASRIATNMLRKPSVQERSVAGGPSRVLASSGALQSRILGHVTKAGVSRPDEQGKRKLAGCDSEPNQPRDKRGRMDEGVGVSIGGYE